MEEICKALSKEGKEEINKALLELLKSTRKLENVSELLHLNGFDRLFQYLKNQDANFMSPAIGIFANCTNTSQQWREKFFKEGGITIIVEILSNTQDHNIISRCARLFGNLSKDPISHSALQEKFIITSFINHGSREDIKCQSACLRMLRKICTDKKCVKMAVENERFSELLCLLNSSEQEIIMLSLRLIRDFLKTQAVEICYRLIECEMLSAIFRYCKHEQIDNQNIAFEILFLLTLNSGCRVTVVMEGGLEIFMDGIKTCNQSESFKYATQSLCLCAREAVSRNRMKNVGALPALVKILSEESFVCFHESIVAAFVSFIFDDLSLGLLIRAGVIPAILKYLDGLTNVEFCKSQERLKNDAIEAEKIHIQSHILGPNEVSLPPEEMSLPPPSRNEDAMPYEQYQQQWCNSSPETSPHAHSSPYSPTSPHVPPNYSPPHYLYCAEPQNMLPSYSPPHSPYANSPQHASSPYMSRHQHSFSPPHSYDTKQAHPNPSPQSIPCFSPQHSTYYGGSPQHSIPSYSPHVSPSYSPPHSSNSSIIQDDVYSDPLNDSAGSSKPLPYHFQSADGIYAMIHGTRGPVHDTLLLLSRFSQANDPSSFFLFLPGFNQLLNYLLLSYNPKPKCARILNRLTLNSHCFEIMLKEKLMPRLYLRLCTGWSLEHLVKMFDDAQKREEIEDEEKADQNGNENCLNEDNLYKWKEPSQATLNLCRLLVSNLRSQSDSSYGKGVLSHIMLTGSTQLKEKVVVSLPHIIRSARLKQRIFCELKAVDLLIRMISSFPDLDSQMFVLNVEAICALFHLVGMSCERVYDIKRTAQLSAGLNEDSKMVVERNAKERKLDGSELKDVQPDNLKGGSVPVAKKRKISDSATDNNPTVKHSKSDNAEILVSVAVRETNWRGAEKPIETAGEERKFAHFEDHLTNPKVLLQLPSKTMITCASKDLSKHSQVFERMLSQTYSDSQKPFISISDVNEQAFVKLIHFMCGCEIRLDIYADCQGICYYDIICKDLHEKGKHLNQNAGESERKRTYSNCSCTGEMIKKHEEHCPFLDSVKNESCDMEVEKTDSLFNNIEKAVDAHDLNVALVYEDGKCSISRDDLMIFATHLLSCAERFFVDALKVRCEEYLMSITTEENVVDLFLFSTLHNSTVLKRYTLMYMLTSISCPRVRTQCFAEILYSNEKDAFLRYLKCELDHFFRLEL